LNKVNLDAWEVSVELKQLNFSISKTRKLTETKEVDSSDQEILQNDLLNVDIGMPLPTPSIEQLTKDEEPNIEI
jgi:hypothetical protein